MKRQIAGLCAEAQHDLPEGLFLVRVAAARYCWHPQKPFFSIRFAVLEPEEFESRSISGRFHCTPNALWKLNWFLRDFGYDPDLLGREEVDERSRLGLQGVVRTVRKNFGHRASLNLDSFALSGEWETLSTYLGSPICGSPDEI